MSRFLQGKVSLVSPTLLADYSEVIRPYLRRTAYFKELSNFIIEVSLVYCKKNYIHFNPPDRHLELVSQEGGLGMLIFSVIS